MGTQRTKAELDTFFADNVTGLITPSRLRDFVESLACSDGSFYVTTPVATAISVAGDFVKAAGTTTFIDGHRTTMPVNNRLLYGGVALVRAHIMANISFICASDDQVILAKNGVEVAHSRMDHLIATGADVQHMTIGADMDLESGDYVELWVTNNTSLGSVTVQRGYVRLSGTMCE